MSTKNDAQMVLECLKIVLKMQHFEGFAPGSHCGGLQHPSDPPGAINPFAPSGRSGRLSHFAPLFEQMLVKFSDIFSLCWTHLSKTLK